VTNDDPLLPNAAPHVEFEHAGDALVIYVRDAAVDIVNCARLRELLATSVAGRDEVVVDLSAVCYADHFGFDAMLQAVRSCPGRVRFRGVRRPIRSLFVIGKLETLLAE
jgi:anti-anti-sigma regulatory factor